MSIMRHVRPSIESVITPIKEGVYETFKGFPDSKTNSKNDYVKFIFPNEGEIYLKYMKDCNELKIVISEIDGMSEDDIIDIGIPLENLRKTDEVEEIMEAIEDGLDEWLNKMYDLALSRYKKMMSDLSE